MHLCNTVVRILDNLLIGWNKHCASAIRYNTTQNKTLSLAHGEICVSTIRTYQNDSFAFMSQHLHQFSCKVVFLSSRCLGKLWQYVKSKTVDAVAVSISISALDYFDSCLWGMPRNKLQRPRRVQNTLREFFKDRGQYFASAIGLLLKTWTYSHFTTPPFLHHADYTSMSWQQSSKHRTSCKN